MRKLALLLVVAGVLTACGGGEPDKISVYCASSMTDTVGMLGWEYEQASGIHVNHNFGASSTLARQISDGAPAHVYFSASRDWMDFLDEKQMLADSPRVFAKNRLVLVGMGGRERFSNLEALAADPPLVIAIADEGVPAGEYARQALKNAGVFEALKSNLVAQKDVRACADAVRRGEAEVGFAYVTDVDKDEQALEVHFTIDAELHDPINCYVATMKGAPPYVKAYVEFMLSDKGHAELKKRGFLVP